MKSRHKKKTVAELKAQYKDTTDSIRYAGDVVRLINAQADELSKELGIDKQIALLMLTHIYAIPTSMEVYSLG